MELEFISTQPVYTGKPTISFNRIGVVSISKTAAEKIGIRENDCVSVAFDKQQPQDWYLVLHADNDVGMKLRRSTSGTLIFNSCAYTREFMTKFSVTERTVRVPLSTHAQPVKDGRAYAIITKAVNPAK